ncbi:MAG: hypothetical protein ACRD5D_07525, partial [Candidatus Polarisedimenticolia bacterium]
PGVPALPYRRVTGLLRLTGFLRSTGLLRGRAARIAFIVANLAATLFMVLAWTELRPVEQVLRLGSWGAGTPSSTCVTAFATLRPWWKRHEPEAVRLTASGGIEPIVRLPRTGIRTTGEIVLPHRSLGYEAFLGAITWARSLGSPDLIFDFPLIIRLQHALLILALALQPLALYLAHPAFRRLRTFVVFNLALVPVLYFRPNRGVYVNDGIIDSALGNILPVAATAAILLLLRPLQGSRRRRLALRCAAGLGLGLAAMVRGEILFIAAFALLVAAAASLKRPERLRRAGAGLALLAVVPLTYGTINLTVFAHFMPLRMQSGQNLYEPIGQFDNPWGIRYDDAWLKGMLAERGIEYVSFEADRHLTGLYLDALAEKPGLFVKNLSVRLRWFAGMFGLWLDDRTIPLVLLLVGFLGWRDERFLLVAVPLLVAIGYLLFFGWTNGLFRLVAPAHFTLNFFLCALPVHLAAQAERFRFPLTPAATRRTSPALSHD